MHTRWTDGQSSVAEMIAAAERAELRAIAITEHVNASSTWYPEFVDEVRSERRRQTGLEVFHGAEIAAADYRGGLKSDPQRLGAELVLGVVHRLPKADGSGFWEFEELEADDAVELELRALLGLATNPQIDVLGHPGGVVYRRYGAFPVARLEPVFRAAREANIAVELNARYLWDLETWLEILHRINPLLSFGSDAHHATAVGCHLDHLKTERAMP
jgi:putative hydrolase